MQTYGLQLVAGPTAEPVSLAVAKSHLRVDASYTGDDAYIAALISTAREHVERVTRRAIYAQTWTLSLDQFPCGLVGQTVAPYVRENLYGNGMYYAGTAIRLPVPRLISVASITYRDADGDSYTVPSESYTVDTRSEPARIVPVNGGNWPSPNSYVPGSVVVTYLAGTYGDGVTVANCPFGLQQAMLLLIGHWYVNREAVTTTPMSNLPLAVDSLLAAYKFYGLIF